MTTKTTALATIIAAMTLGTASAHADDKWIPFRTGGDTFDIRAGSLDFERGRKTGMPYATVILRIRFKGQTEIDLKKGAVALADCDSGFGKLNIHDLNSGAYIDSVEWVDGAGTIASGIAEAICGAAERKLAERKQPEKRVPSALTL